MFDMNVLAEGLARYFSEAELARLGAARIGIAGAGGLGSNVAALLVRSGIRRFLVVDGDVVDASNLNRQFFWPEDMGRPKTLALRERLLALRPDLEFEARVEWLEPGAAAGIFAACDLVVEALDDAAQKAALCSALLGAGFFVVAASGLAGTFGNTGRPMTVRRLGHNFVCVGDFVSGVNALPPLAPRVMQAAALQADVVLSRILEIA